MIHFEIGWFLFVTSCHIGYFNLLMLWKFVEVAFVFFFDTNCFRLLKLRLS